MFRWTVGAVALLLSRAEPLSSDNPRSRRVEQTSNLPPSTVDSNGKEILARERDKWYKTLEDDQSVIPPVLDVSPAIVGGTVTEPEEFRSFVASERTGGVCGGILIHKDIVLTAGHCEGVFKHGARVGAHTRDENDNTELRQVTQEVLHPQYVYNSDQDDFRLLYDYMLLKLDSPVTNIEPAKLNIQRKSFLNDDEQVRAIGFGRDAINGTGTPQLMKVDLDVVNFETCQMILASVAKEMIEDVMICAGGSGRAACTGDSGGPLFDITTGEVLGVTSFRSDCNNFPSVFARVSAASDWILDQVCTLSDDPPPSCAPAQQSCAGRWRRCAAKGCCVKGFLCTGNPQYQPRFRCKKCAKIKYACNEDRDCCGNKEDPTQSTAACGPVRKVCFNCQGQGKFCRKDRQCCSGECNTDARRCA